MIVECIWEHNDGDTLLYSSNFIGAYTRGSSLQEAIKKMPKEIILYESWKGNTINEPLEIKIVQEKESTLQICDADSDVIFDSERKYLTIQEYNILKDLALKSAQDFYKQYKIIPNKDASNNIIERETFYGIVPRTARQMYLHTKNVNSYYFSQINIDANNDGTIYECRKKGFELLEKKENFLNNKVYIADYNEEWSLRKVLRRFIWHDRIHAKAMYKMSKNTFPDMKIENIFDFDI